ncbi:hypothetical protein [Aquimarina sp. RZ0]|uniref:hypothetical protein n=1 Tax=Aquimarina sp. RZ0 TaxID=2607730 RepID=UPI0011F105B2|nr:hypothetical protein [Aquimarina sp. RZ0]KAA1242581.1 hypothetical protein F0000_25000 [Aquimarina sp. RZ0]
MKKIIIAIHIYMPLLIFGQNGGSGSGAANPNITSFLFTPIPTKDPISDGASLAMSIQYLLGTASGKELENTLKEFNDVYKKRKKYLVSGTMAPILPRMYQKVNRLNLLTQTLQLINNRQKDIFFKRKAKRREKLKIIQRRLLIIENGLKKSSGVSVYGEKLNQLMDLNLNLQPIEFELIELSIALENRKFITKMFYFKK